MAVTPPDDARSELAAIYDREADYVWRSLERLGVPRSERPDLTQEVFLVVHRKLGDYDRSRPIRPWLFGIAFRVAVGFKRRAQRGEVLEDPSGDLDPKRSPEELTLISERWTLAMRALQHIPLERRAVFIRHCIEGASVVEVAEELEIPVNTAYSRLRLSRRDFRRAVEELTAEGRAEDG